jgi:hypothetical protein
MFFGTLHGWCTAVKLPDWLYRAFHNVYLIKNMYNKETKETTLMEMFTVTGKLKKFFLTTWYVRCVHHGWHGTHRYDIHVLATHALTCVHRYSSLLQWSVRLGSEEYRCARVDACVAIPLLSYRLVPCHPWCTHRTSLVVRKKLFSIFLWLWTIPLGRSFRFLVINICNHAKKLRNTLYIKDVFRWNPATFRFPFR